MVAESLNLFPNQLCSDSKANLTSYLLNALLILLL